MKRVKVSHKDGRKWGAEFADPTSWQAEQIQQNSWGQPERIVEADGNYDQADVLESYPEVVEGDVTVEPARVKLKAEYSIEIEDITAELAANESKKQKLESAKNDLKSVRSLITDAKDATTDVKQRQVLIKLAKAVLQLSKAAGIADANEAED